MQAALYHQHVREVRQLARELKQAEARASAADAQRAEDAVRIESWSTMADALETRGDEQERKVALMGRRLTALRVQELSLSRQASAQLAELKGLRHSRTAGEAEAREAAVEASAALNRVEREKVGQSNPSLPLLLPHIANRPTSQAFTSPLPYLPPISNIQQTPPSLSSLAPVSHLRSS